MMSIQLIDRCGQSWFTEKMIHVDYNFTHHGETLLFMIETNLNRDAT